MTPKRRNPQKVVVLALGLPHERLERLSAELATLREMTDAFQAVIVTDSIDLRPISGNGHMLEHVMAYDDWVKINDPARWSRYVERRLGAIVRLYRARNIVIVADLVPADGEVDRNLYACLLRLNLMSGQDNVQSAFAELADEISYVSLQLLRLEKQHNRLARSIAAAGVGPARLAGHAVRKVRRLVGGRLAPATVADDLSPACNGDTPTVLDTIDSKAPTVAEPTSKDNTL